MTLRGVKIAGNLDEELDDEYRYHGSRIWLLADVWLFLYRLNHGTISRGTIDLIWSSLYLDGAKLASPCCVSVGRDGQLRFLASLDSTQSRGH